MGDGLVQLNKRENNNLGLNVNTIISSAKM